MTKLEYVVEEGYHGRIIELRQEVLDFALEMEQVLKENDHKTGWDELSVHALYDRIKQEFEEFQREYILAANHFPIDNTRLMKMRKESIDLANYCMFLCHNYPKKEV